MVASIKLSAAEWEKISSQHEESQETDGSKRVRIEYDKIPFMQKSHSIPGWVLTSLIVLSLVGGGWIGYQVSLHYKAVLLGLGFIGLFIIGIKVATGKRRR